MKIEKHREMLRSPYLNFSAVKDSPHLFDNYTKYFAGWVLENGKINNQEKGAESTFFVGLPIYDYNYCHLGVLSYVCDQNGHYWWKILGYYGKEQRIKTYWQVVKECQALKQGVINE